MKHIGLFAAGVLFGTAGIKLLGSKDAKKVYTHCTAAVLRAKDCVMQAVTNIRENAEDVTRARRRSMTAVRRMKPRRSSTTPPSCEEAAAE